MRLYRSLYSRGMAVTLVVAAWLALAISQTRVVFEGLAHMHEDWPAWALWLAAAGFELATLAVGLVIAVAGASVRLWLGLALFVAISSWWGFDGAMRSQLDGEVTTASLQDLDAVLWARAVFGGALLPVMYLAAIMAGHQLAERTRDAGPPRMAPRRTFTGPERSRATPTSRRDRPAPSVEEIALSSEPGTSKADIAREAGVHASTVTRRLAAAGIEQDDVGRWLKEAS